MALTLPQLRAKVLSQKTALPALYGKVDFDLQPERFDDTSASLGATARPSHADPERVARVRAYTMLGDVVADAYAALMPTYGFRNLIAMLTRACDSGLDGVQDAPPQLVAFIRAMEQIPAWLDMKLVEDGARIDRNTAANVAPFLVRGAFIATFMNKYAALPMALTGALSTETSARRVKETATFFTTSVLPGALTRHGPGFRAAAMVRLMHSMVRFNALRSKAWDVAVYGIPIPQVDQMPAGLIAILLLSRQVIAQGRTAFTPQERARVELARYRCFLLGLPEELLPDTPQGIIDIMNLRDETLRKGFDDATCGQLVRATLAADLSSKDTLGLRLYSAVEPSFAKVFFLRRFLEGDEARARAMGVTVTGVDKFVAAATAAFLFARGAIFDRAARIAFLAGPIDEILVRKIRRQLARLGHAEFTTDASAYKPATSIATTQTA